MDTQILPTPLIPGALDQAPKSPFLAVTSPARLPVRSCASVSRPSLPQAPLPLQEETASPTMQLLTELSITEKQNRVGQVQLQLSN